MPANGDPLSLNIRDDTPLDPSADTNIGYIARGRIAEIVFKGLAPGGTFDAQKVHLTVADPGFDGEGNAVTRERTFTGAKILRRQWPNNAELMIEANGGDVLVRFVLRFPIYAASTIVAVTVDAGAYTGSNAGSPVAITNNSQRSYRKPLFGWLNMPYERATGVAYDVEAVAYHRHAMLGRQVACIRFDASDAAGNTAPTQLANMPALSTILRRGLPPECYAASIPLVALDQGSQCNVSARVYPWIGDASAVLDLAVDGAAMPTSMTQALLPFVCDKDGSWGGATAFVSPVRPIILSSGHFGGTYTYAGIEDGASGNTSGANAFDGSAGTNYISTSDPNVWLGVRFPQPINVNELRITASTGSAADTPTGFVLKYSDDGTAWTEKGIGTIVSGAWSAGQTRSFPVAGGNQAAHAWWRVERLDGPGFMAIGELAFAAIAGGPNLVRPTVSYDLAAARLAPFADIGTALTAVAAFNATQTSRNNHSGSTIYLMDAAGANAVHQVQPSTAAAGPAWTDIAIDPDATGIVTLTNLDDGVYPFLPERLRFSGDQLRLDTGNRFLILCQTYTGTMAIDGCRLTMRGKGSAISGFRRLYARNMVFDDAPAPVGPEVPMMAGCEVADGVGIGAVAAMSLVGCRLPGAEFNVAPAPDANHDSIDGGIWANNHFRHAGDPLFNQPIARGFAFVQNLVELTDAPHGTVALSISADGTSHPCDNVIEQYDSIMGDKGNHFYNDSTASVVGAQKDGSMRFNLWHDWNCKSDSQGHLDGEGTTGRVGNFGPHYNVESEGNLSMYGSKQGQQPGEIEGYLGDYWPPDSEPNAYINSAVPTFVDDQATGINGTRGNTGPGGGDYHLTGITNTAYNRVPAGRAGLSFDLEGAPRRNDGSGALGAYERIDATGGSVTGPTTGRVGSPTLPITVALNGLPAAGTVFTPHLTGVTGSFSPATLAFAAGARAASLSLTPSSGGTATLSWSNNQGYANPAPIEIVIARQTYAVTGPTTGSQSAIMGPYTIAVTGTLLTAVHVIPGDGGAGGQILVDGAVVTSLALPAATSPSIQFGYLPNSSGTVTLTFPNDGGLPMPAEMVLMVATEGPRSGAVTVPAARRIDLPIEIKLTANLGIAVSTALVFPAQFDPGDYLPFAIGFRELLAGDAIDSILHFAPNEEAWGLGIRIGTGAGRPIIDGSQGVVGFTPFVADGSQTDGRFAGEGYLAGLTIKIGTAAGSRIERTVFLRICQLSA